MPTPIDLILDPISLIIFVLYGSLMLWEGLFPGRELPRIKGWKFRGLLSFVFYFYLSSYLPLFWDQYLYEYQLFDLSGLGVAGGTIIGLLIYQLGVYIWHRSMHKFDTLWLGIHQMHHSVERIDTYGAFYFSPLGMIAWTALGSLCLTLLAGFDPGAITLIILLATFLTIFQHSNIKTPQWLGYIIQRPESHTIHHGKGLHAYNYSDLPIYDILFGTFKNPKAYEMETGFYEGASERIWDMILFRDVSEPKVKNQEA